MIKRQLPRPATLEKFKLSADKKADAEAVRLISEQVETLILYENAVFPIQGGPPSQGNEEPEWFTQAEMARARDLLSEETRKSRQDDGLEDNFALLDAFDASRSILLDKTVFLRSRYADVTLKKADEPHYIRELKEDVNVFFDFFAHDIALKQCETVTTRLSATHWRKEPEESEKSRSVTRRTYS